MKKFYILILALASFFTMQAQWVNDPVNNTFIANSSADAGEIYLSTDPISGDTYVQWNQFYTNGWSPTLQRLNFEGEPQWTETGIHIGAYEFSSYSQGISMTATTDGAVVSCFADYEGYTYAVKINADGTFAWGEEGILLFGGQGFSRTEVTAGNDGGFWALGSDQQNLFLQYINADGTTNPMATISDQGGQGCMFGQLTLSNNNNVFVTYEKLGSGFYTDKEIFVAGYATDGTQISAETLLMASQTFQSTYIHYAVSDGMGGGYVYIWHPAFGEAFNTYVFHFNENGASTIMDTDGVPVHSIDSDNFYLGANATVDPESHDLIIAYEQTDAAYQIQSKIYINRITSSGERLWDEGILVHDNGTIPCGGIRADAFEYGGGFSIIYHRGVSQTSMASTIEAKGFDMDGNVTWETEMCSSLYNKSGDDNTPGFHFGQNIVAWTHADNGGIYGQNIGEDGSMGEVTPPIPPTPCYAPTDFMGESFYDPNTQISSVVLSWTAPETQPLHYNLYCEGVKEVIEIDGDVETYELVREPGDYIFKLTAVYEDCESDYALTPSGDDYLLIEIVNHESVPENEYEEIVTVKAIYNLNGQRLNCVDVNELNDGIYIIQGITKSGKSVNKKVVVRK